MLNNMGKPGYEATMIYKHTEIENLVLVFTLLHLDESIPSVLPLPEETD